MLRCFSFSPYLAAQCRNPQHVCRPLHLPLPLYFAIWLLNPRPKPLPLPLSLSFLNAWLPCGASICPPEPRTRAPTSVDAGRALPHQRRPALAAWSRWSDRRHVDVGLRQFLPPGARLLMGPPPPPSLFPVSSFAPFF